MENYNNEVKSFLNINSVLNQLQIETSNIKTITKDDNNFYVTTNNQMVLLISISTINNSYSVYTFSEEKEHNYHFDQIYYENKDGKENISGVLWTLGDYVDTTNLGIGSVNINSTEFGSVFMNGSFKEANGAIEERRFAYVDLQPIEVIREFISGGRSGAFKILSYAELLQNNHTRKRV